MFFLNFGFSIGIYDNSEYFYYINNANPTVEINISSGSDELQVKDAILYIDEREVNYQDSTVYINRFSERKFIFELDKSISEARSSKFKLFVYNNDGTKLIEPQGDSIDFFLKFDNILPECLNVKNEIRENNRIILEFSEPIDFVNVKINGKVVGSAKNVDNKFVINEKYVTVYFDDFAFNDFFYNLEIEFSDLAGNINTANEEIIVSIDPLTVRLLTLRDDSSLLYNYNEEYSELFDGEIFTSNRNFVLKVETNKPAECFLVEGLDFFIELEDVNSDSLEPFSSTDNIIHSFNLNNLYEVIWVGCRNLYTDKEVAYLEEEFGRNLITIEQYDGAKLQIIYAEPSSLVTNNPFSVFATTNERAACFYEIDTNGKTKLETEDFKQFQALDLSYTGNHDLTFECYDVMNNKVALTNEIEIDESRGTKVVAYNPKYTMQSSVSINISLSDFNGVDCRYSDEQIAKSAFSSLPNMTGTGLARTFEANNLNPGENFFYIYCKKNGQTTTSNITVIYDNKGIIISNFTFINGNYESSEYIGSTESVKFKFDITSLISIEEYLAMIDVSNSTQYKKISSTHATIKGDFSSADKIKIVATNKLGINKTYENVLRYDGTPPVISFSDIGNGKKIACSDIGSGCAEIYYGFSQTNIDCNANALYNAPNSSEVLDISGKNYLCVEAYDFANQKTVEIVSCTISYNNEPIYNPPFVENNENESNYNNSEENNENNEENNENNNEDPFNPTVDPLNNDDEGTSIILVAAIIIIFACIGGGGYYAYKKGYLDKELTKLGIPLNSKKSQNGSKSDVNFTSKPISNNPKTNKNMRKSTYDDHLNKLNKFIDDKVSKSDPMFKKFEESNKGKVKGYKDTLMHNQKSKPDLTKQDFDEFYHDSSGKRSGAEIPKSLEKEAESFEDYYKQKKAKVSSDKSKKK